MANEFIARKGLISKADSTVSGSLNISGSISLTDGSASSPAIKFASDTDTGIYRAGGNQLSITTGGTERLRVDSTGIEIPASAKLGTTNNAFNYIQLYRGSDASMLFRMGHPTVGRFGFLNSSDTEVFTVDARNERVGIGTTSPTSKLHVLGDIMISGSTNHLLVKGDNTKYGRIYHNSAGIVLDGAIQNQGLYLGTSSWRWVNGVSMYGGDIRFYTGSTEQAMHIEGTTGNVGIGTTSPNFKLDVATGNNDGLRVENSTNTSYASIQNFSSGPVLNMYDTSTNNTVRIRSYASSGVQAYFTAGNVGIGTIEPEVKLDVRGQLLVAGDTPDARIGSTLEVYRSGSTAELSIHQDDSSAFNAFSQLRFRNGGNDTYLKVPTSVNGLIIDVENQANALVMDVYGNTTIANNLVVQGSVTAQEFHTEFVSASIIYQSGSTKFGDTADDVHEFTGSISLSGSTYINNPNGTSKLIVGESPNSEVNAVVLESNGAGNKTQIYSTGTSNHMNISAIGNSSNIYLSSNQNITFRTNNGENKAGGSDRLFISQSGDIGIGTTSPTAKLQVEGGLFVANASIKVVENSVTNYYHSDKMNSYGSHYDWRFSGNTKMRIKSSGDVGIGTSIPTEKLHISGSQRIDGDELYLSLTGSSRKPVRLHHNEYKGAITLQRDGISNVNISADEPFQGHTYFNGNGTNVGIGNTAPQHKLDVTGQGRFTDGLIVTGSLVLTGSLSAFGAAFTDPVTIYDADATENPRLSLGRSETQSLNFDVEDRIATIFHKQDETTGNQALRFEVHNDSPTKYFQFGFRDTDGTNHSIPVHISSSGAVGIGTTNPTHKLHLGGLSTSAIGFGGSSLRIGNYTSIGTTRIYSDGLYLSYSTANSYHDFTNAGSSLMRITSAGNVGIGTTTPDSLLHIAGNSATAIINLQRTNTSANGSKGQLNFLDSSGDYVAGIGAIPDDIRDNSGELVFRTSTSGSYSGGYDIPERMRIDASGKVGIGTSAPAGLLHIYNSGTVGGAKGIILENSTFNTQYGIYAGINGVTSGGFSIFDKTNLANRLVITETTGNVGIGTTNPAQKLQVAGRVRATTDPTFEVYEAANKRGGFQWDSTNDYVNIFSTGGDMRFDLGGEKMRITSAGNVGIGITSPTKELHVAGEISGSDIYIDDWNSVSASLSTLEGSINGFVNGTGADTRVAYWSDSNTLTSNSGFTFDGTTLTAPNFVETSAKKYKENIQPLTGSLDKVTQMQGVSFNKIGESTLELGYIADEVFDIVPELVHLQNGEVEGIHYPRVTALLGEAVKELNDKVQAQELFIRDLVARIEKLENK